MHATTREKYAIPHYILEVHMDWACSHGSMLGAVYFQDTVLSKPCIYIGICLYTHTETLEEYPSN